MSRRFADSRRAMLSGILAFSTISGLALAQTHQGHGSHSAAPVAATSAETPATKAFRAANDEMHKAMDIPFSGDADADFVKGMIPHHQGAVAMARIVLAHGKDPELKKLATGIIADQEKEIAFMREWLKKNSK